MLRPGTHLRCATLGLALAVTIASYVAPSLAQGLTDPVAIQLKRQGDSAIESGEYQKALDLYSKALSLEPSPALHYNRGRALQALGRNSEALSEFERFEETAPAELRSAVPELNDMITLVRQQIAEVKVSCDVPGATLRVRGRSLTLPLRRPLRFDPASFDVEVVAAGYEPWRTRLTLEGGEQRELVPRLKPLDLRGTIVVTSPIGGALAQVDGKTVGAVPVEIRLTPGEHAVSLLHPDYQTAGSRFVLRSGERRPLSIAMQQLPRWYERWWFWTGVGAVVTTSVIVAIAVSTERSPAKGDIPPGQITSPLLAW